MSVIVKVSTLLSICCLQIGLIECYPHPNLLHNRNHKNRDTKTSKTTASTTLCHDHSAKQTDDIHLQIHTKTFTNKIEMLQIDIDRIIGHLACKFDSKSCSRSSFNNIMSTFPTLSRHLSIECPHKFLQDVSYYLTQSYYNMTNIEQILQRLDASLKMEDNEFQRYTNILSNDLHSFICYIHSAGYAVPSSVPSCFESDDESELLKYYIEIIKHLHDFVTEILNVLYIRGLFKN